ncbi:Protein of unknown function [Bacillus toyonensis]|nr:Protein of unknown function [Bacillus toyonensis]
MKKENIMDEKLSLIE